MTASVKPGPNWLCPTWFAPEGTAVPRSEIRVQLGQEVTLLPPHASSSSSPLASFRSALSNPSDLRRTQAVASLPRGRRGMEVAMSELADSAVEPVRAEATGG